MAHTVGLGTVNFPKLMRHLGHRTNQVRDLVFIRDPIYRKEVMTTKANSASGRGSGTTSLEGPTVSFGYEESSSAAQSAGTNTAYHVNSPRMIFPSLKAIQSPITSRSGKLERTGHRISGECTFYLPSLDYIKSLENFGEYTGFDEIETYDKLIDIERIVHNPTNISATAEVHTITFADTTPGYELDRVQFKTKTTGASTLSQVELYVNDAGTAKMIRWQADSPISMTAGREYTFDFPFRDLTGNSTWSQWVDGVEYEFETDIYLTGTTTGTTVTTDTLYGDSNNELTSLKITYSDSEEAEITDIYLYKQAEWRVESIKDYRDEYMQVEAVRVRGDRTSRRRAYG